MHSLFTGFAGGIFHILNKKSLKNRLAMFVAGFFSPFFGGKKRLL